MKILNNCMPEKRGKCRYCHNVGWVSASEDYWHEGLCYNCTIKEVK